MSYTDPAPVPLSFLVKKMHTAVVRNMRGVFLSLINNNLWEVNSDHWQVDDQKILLGSNGVYGSFMTIKFNDVVWDPEHTDEEYGDRKVLHGIDKSYKGAGFLAALKDSEEDLDYNQQQSVTQTHSREVTLDQETHFDIGSKTGVTIGGDSSGGKLEQELSVEFGMKFETTQTEAESTDETVVKTIDYTFPAHKDTLLRLDTRSVQSQRSLRINAVAAMGFLVTLNPDLVWKSGYQQGWMRKYLFNDANGSAGGVEKNGGNYEFGFGGWADFIDMLSGFNVKYPGMIGFLADARKNDTENAKARESLFDNATRQIAWTGIQHETEDGVITLDISDVTGQDLGALKEKYALNEGQTHDPNGRITG